LKQLIRIFCGILFCLAADCGGYKHPLPPVRVDFTINPNDVFYLNLNSWGGHEYFKGGVCGVVVYRLDEWSFTAFDRGCPYDWEEPDSWIWVCDDGITLQCTKCGSMFNILDGGVITGPSKYALKRYYTKYDGMRLRVHS